MQTEQHADSATVRVLNRMVRGELAAAAAYDQALTHIDHPEDRMALEQNRESHATRAVMLGQLVEREGGTPAHHAGPLGVVAQLVERGAAFVGRNTLLRALREAELSGLDSYATNVKTLPANAAEEVVEHALIEQQLSLNRIEGLLKEPAAKGRS
jgi:hypothetical protein